MTQREDGIQVLAFQIEFLTSIDRMGFVLVGVFESAHGLVDVGSRDGRVIGTIDALGF